MTRSEGRGIRGAGSLMGALVGFMGCVVVALVSLPAFALGAGSASGSASPALFAGIPGGAGIDGVGASSPLSGSLVIVGSPEEGQELWAAALARHASPEAVAAREVSRTAYEHLDAAGAAGLSRHAFPSVVDTPAGGIPSLRLGEHLVRFLSDTAAQLSLPRGERGVLESLGPMAHKTSSGQFVPVNLSLVPAGGGAFAPRSSRLSLRIPARVSAGIALPGTGVSVTPLDSHGAPVAGAPATADGAAVLYTNTLTYADTLVKPTTSGFEIDALLRSAESPSELRFRVGMPLGSTLVRDAGTGAVRIVRAGATLAIVHTPSARDAEGNPVPVSMSVSGSVIALQVPHKSGSYLYPIAVDPEVTDKELVENHTGSESESGGRWEYHAEPSPPFAKYGGNGSLGIKAAGEYKATNWAAWAYQTQGVSKIYEVKAVASGENTGAKIENYLELEYAEAGKEVEYGKPHDEKSEPTPISNEFLEPKYTKKSVTVCSAEGCPTTGGKEKNAVVFETSASASGSKFNDELTEGAVYIGEPAGTHATAEFNRSSTEIEVEVEENGKKVKQKRTNALYGAQTWLSKYQGALELISRDTGIGVAATKLEYESTPGHWEQLSAHNYREQKHCEGVQCYPEHKEWWLLESKLPDGEDKIRYRAEEAAAETESPETEATATIKVDKSKPHNLTLDGLPYGNELSERKYEMTAEATDGEGSEIAASGIKSLKVYIEGSNGENKEITKTGGTGECSALKGPCTATARYSLEGAELGAGQHQITIVAIDNAGNEAREYEPVTIQHSTPVPLGPGSVDLQSGDFTLGATDVSMGSGLTVTRAYSSKDLTEGETGALGPQWTMSLGAAESLHEMIDGSMLLTDATGHQTIFALVTPKTEPPTYESPVGDSDLHLTVEENKTTKEKLAYYLENTSTHTKDKFTLPSGEKAWVPTVQEGVVATDTVSYAYETLEPEAGKKLLVPTEVRAVVPPKVSCTPMKAGCRALKFRYATETKATGETPSGWNEYKDRLASVYLEAYNPETKEMAKEPGIPVAEYAYDSKGRLRAEWDPRVSPALKTMYGYDAEGHVTAMTPPGQESWVFIYGTTRSNVGSGRLVKAVQAPASAGLWGGEPVADTEAPKITGSSVVGATLTVSNGAWSGNPVAYGYQWERCNLEGKECSAIGGAIEASYAPVLADLGHKLIAKVTALNGGGAVVASSAATAEVTPESFSVRSGSEPYRIAVGPDGNLWFTEKKANIIGKITTSGTVSEYLLPSKSEPYDIVAGPDKNMWFTEHGTSKIGKITTSGTVSEPGTLPTKSEPVGIAVGPDGNLWFSEYGTNKIGKITTSGTITEYATKATGECHPYGIQEGPDKALWFTLASFPYCAESLGRITTSGEARTYTLSTASAYGWLAGRAGGYLWATELGKILRFTTSGGLTSYRAREGSEDEAESIAEGPEANMWFTDHETKGSAKYLGTITSAGSVTAEYQLPSAAAPVHGIVTGPDKNLWFTGYESIWKVDLNVAPAKQTGVQPGWTVEYGVPLQGTEAPAQMGFNETTRMHEPVKWGQRAEEDPVEATAILPPDARQGWPASSYKRATTYYMDQRGRVVNVATPSDASAGAIGTTEYNEFNDVTRTLTPGNRERALQAGCESEEKCKSAEESKLLDTENTYNGEGAKEGEVAEPGTQLIETVGPEHIVKYTAGEEQYEAGEKPKEAMARSYTRNYYDEGAPSENPRTHRKEAYNLLTKSQNYAELTSPTNKERVDARTTVTAYSGQNDLGWLLRAPTSTTVNPGSLKLTTTTVYEENAAKESNGQVVETRGAGAEGTFTYASKFGEAGSEEGKLKGPFGLAIDWKGNLWTVDEGNSRVEEFDTEGKHLATFGKAGTGAGEFKEPKGIAIEGKEKGAIWVADSGNNRVQEFNFEGKEAKTFGKAGTGLGEFKEPKALAADSKGDVWVADTGNNRIEEINSKGEYSAFGKLGTGNGEFKEPKGIAIDSKGNIWVADTNNNRIQEFEPSGKFLAKFGAVGTGAGQLKFPFGLAFDAAGHLWVADEGNNRVQEFATSGAFISQFGWKGKENGQVSEPRAITFTPGGEAWVSDTANNRLEEFAKGSNAHDGRMIFYSSEENKEAGFEECGKHPEWEGLPCETLPAKQPELDGLPKLPITTTKSYNVFDEPETVEEKFVRVNTEKHEETTTRTKKNSYDEAGRVTKSETTSSTGEDKPLPPVTSKYNESNGLLETQSAEIKGEVKTITSKYNTLGQLTEYTDADGSKATFKYAGSENDDLLEEMTDGSAEGAGHQIYSYDETTKQLTKLWDSGAETFTATYNTEGQLASETYPNGMCANYTYNQAGEATRVEYIKTTNCAEEKPTVWYYDERTPGIRGEAMSQASSLASETYGYDQSGRMTEAHETPTGEGCTTRLYLYDEPDDRIGSATAKPNTKGECTNEGATIEAHNYDEAGRLTDEGITYDAFGNITKLPAADAEKHALTSSFYVTNAIASQEQENAAKEIVKNEYELDPLGRVLETTTGSKHAISHYDGTGETVAWTCEAPSTSETCEKEKWTRNIPGIDGALAAVESSGSRAVLQLHDLQGNVVATAALSPTETKLLSTYNSTEFGVPNKEKAPPKFAWLGAGGVSDALSSGVITYGATSYVPQTGMPLQSEQVEPVGEGGSGAGAPYHKQVEPWVWQGAKESAAEAPGREAGRQREAAEAACRANPRACVGLGFGEDPEKSLLLTTRQAEVIAAGLRHGSASLEKIAASKTISGFTEFFAGRIIELGKDYMIGIANGLHICVAAIQSTNKAVARCRLFVKWETIYGYDITTGFGVETCWGDKEKLAGKIILTFPYCAAAVRSPANIA